MINYEYILVRYGELSLKKSNRRQFSKMVNDHIMSSLKQYKEIRYVANNMRFYIYLNGVDCDKVIDILKKIPGIFSFSPVVKCEEEIEAIKKACYDVLSAEDYHNKTFKIETNRADKNFPFNSLEISRQVAGYLFSHLEGLKADVHKPDIQIDLDVRSEGAFIYTKTYYGLAGLPNGSLGKGLLMISGGIDSVVAGFLAIKKGVEVYAIHFSSPPYTSMNALQKVVDLLEVLTPYTKGNTIKLFNVPFTKIQEKIYELIRSDYCITVMRRMMYRIGEKIAEQNNCLAIINGESIGQVASQTLESIKVINETIKMPVIRPLATYDKLDIIEISKKINAFDISTRPYEDCCTIFVPRHPQIRPQLSKAIELENKINYEELIDEAIKNVEIINITHQKHYNVFGDIKLF